jgi:WNK lysine deficient protein kinase
VRNVHFTFYLDSDTSLGVAGEMVEQLELGDHHVPFLSEFIDYLIMRLVPEWRPITEELANGDNASIMVNSSTLANDFTMENGLNGMSMENNSRDSLSLPLGNGSVVLPDSNRLSSCMKAVCEEMKFASGGSLTSVELVEATRELKANSGSSLTLGEMEEVKSDVSSAAAENCNCETGESSAPDRCDIAEAAGKKALNGCTLHCLDEDDEELQTEIHDIKEHYRHLFEELNRMQEIALENARKRWMRKLGKRSA